MRCQFCKQEIKPDSTVCEWCGRRQETKPEPAIEAAAPPPPITRALYPKPAQVERWQNRRSDQIPAGNWAQFCYFLRRDTALMITFFFIGLESLFSIWALSQGVGNPLLNVAIIVTFFGVLSWQNWARIIAMITQGGNALFAIPVALFSFNEGSFFTGLLFGVFGAGSAIAAVVLIMRREYFD
jgi:hypothetical protein